MAEILSEWELQRGIYIFNKHLLLMPLVWEWFETDLTRL